MFTQRFTAGSITVVLGANRSGKSDLCRLVTGLDTQATGQVVLDDIDISAHAPAKRDVSMVYQSFVNYPNLTVAQNIATPMRASGATNAEIEQKVARLADQLQLAALLDRYPAQLSGGQQQRLAIARAMAKQPRVLVLDEPLVNLDFKLREALELELRQLLREQNIVVIYTSSDPRDAFNLGDQVVLLHEGSKVQAGIPIEVYERPASLAAMNLLADPSVNRHRVEDREIAVRPEHVSLEAIADPGLEVTLNVSAYETNGNEYFIHATVRGSDEVWVVRGRGMPSVQVGQATTAYVRQADLVSF